MQTVTVFDDVPCILPANKGPPPAKADRVSASGKTRPFAHTARADFKQNLYIHTVTYIYIFIFVFSLDFLITVLLSYTQCEFEFND